MSPLTDNKGDKWVFVEVSNPGESSMPPPSRLSLSYLRIQVSAAAATGKSEQPRHGSAWRRPSAASWGTDRHFQVSCEMPFLQRLLVCPGIPSYWIAATARWKGDAGEPYLQPHLGSLSLEVLRAAQQWLWVGRSHHSLGWVRQIRHCIRGKMYPECKRYTAANKGGYYLLALCRKESLCHYGGCYLIFTVNSLR